MSPPSPKIFISYSHDSKQHKTFILTLANRLRQDRLDCIIDQYVNGFPAEGWPRWMETQVEQADFVLVVCTPLYLKRYRGLDEDGGRGVNFEGVVISQTLYDNYYRNTKFLPVLPDDGNFDNVPLALKGFGEFRAGQDYEKIYRFLTGQAAVSKPVMGEPVILDGGKNLSNTPPVNIEHLIPPIKSDDKLREYLADQISTELEMYSKCNKYLCEQLAKKLDHKGEVTTEKSVAELLVARDTAEAIEVLTTATVICIRRYSNKVELVEEIKKTAQQVLGWLVLGSLDHEQVAKITPHCVEHASLFFTLAVKTLTGVEVVMARCFNRPSNLVPESGPEQKSRHLINVPTSGLKWDEEPSDWLMFSAVWNSLFRNKKLENTYEFKPEEWDWSRLNAELKARRSRSLDAEHFYIPFKASEYEQAELSSYVVDVYQRFLSKLDQLTIIQYGEVGNDDNLFVVTEDDLLAAINDFYLRINGK